MSAYLDANATVGLLPEVLEAMGPWLGAPANPSSVHRLGQAAAAATERARARVAALVGRDPAGVVFTSGATEANHQALRGWASLGARRVALSGLEHPCVHAALAASGVERVAVPVDPSGRARWGEVEAVVDLVVCMAANHETGIVQDLEAAGRLGPLHVDAAQGAGRLALDLDGAASVVLSSHKLGGPGGVGALSLADGDPFPSLLSGGSQERGRRAGTVPVALVVGFGAACALAVDERAERVRRWSRQLALVDAALGDLGARHVGAGPRLPNTRCVVFPGLSGESVVQGLDLRGVCVSSGAACASGSLDPSPVLVAMGDPEPGGAVRISLGPRTGDDEIDALLRALPGVLRDLRAVADLDL